jgi:hypothetical protein
MSTLKADTIVASDGTSPVTLTKQTTAKAHGVFDMSNNTTPDSFNIASFTDRATGCLYGNYTNSMSSASHTVTGSSSPVQEGTMGTNNYNRYVIASSDTASRYSENSRDVSGNTAIDDPYIAAVSHGDLA